MNVCMSVCYVSVLMAHVNVHTFVYQASKQASKQASRQGGKQASQHACMHHEGINKCTRESVTPKCVHRINTHILVFVYIYMHIRFDIYNAHMCTRKRLYNSQTCRSTGDRCDMQMYGCRQVHGHIHTKETIHTYIQPYILVYYMHTCMPICMYVCACMHACMQAGIARHGMHGCMYVCMYVFVYVCNTTTYVCMDLWTHTHTHVLWYGCIYTYTHRHACLHV